MNVTPTDSMLKAMNAFVDSTVGEAPLDVETTRAAEQRRIARRVAMDYLHSLVRLSMREGVARFMRDAGHPTAPDEVRPNALAREMNRANSSNILELPAR